MRLSCKDLGNDKALRWRPHSPAVGEALVVAFIFKDAIAAYGRAIELDPKLAYPHNGLGDVYRALCRYEDAIAAYGWAVELDPKYDSPHWGLGIVYQLLKQYGKAEEAFCKAVELDPQSGTYRSSLVGILRILGRDAEAAEQTKITRELIAKEGKYNRACFEAICGNADEALALLKTALEKREESLEWVERDPDFDSLRGDPRFAALIEEMKARFAAGERL